MVAKQHSDNTYSSCWFAACFSSDLQASNVLTKMVMEEEIVLYRTIGGSVCAVEPHCPHLGAHLGNGRVVNGEIECPFHGFRFDGSGVCTHSYPGKKPAKAKLALKRVVEKYGLIFVWAGEGEPTWELPEVDGFEEGWSSLIEFQQPFLAKQQNVLENLVDFGHLDVIHKVKDYNLDSLEIHEHEMKFTTSQRVERPELAKLVNFLSHIGVARFFDFARNYNPSPPLFHTSLFGFSSSMTVDFRIIGVCGGIAEINTNHGLVNKYRMRQIIFPSPSSGGELTYRTAFQFKRLDGRSFNGGLGGALETLKLKMLARGAYQEILDEMYLWESQVYKATPILADGDGIIGKYRGFLKKYCHRKGNITLMPVEE